MIIGRDYLLEKPSGPSAPKVFFDTRVVPLVVNGAGDLEVVLARTSARTGVRPAVLLAGVAGLLSLVALRLLRQRAAANGHRP